jgi:glutaredoxin-related protein
MKGIMEQSKVVLFMKGSPDAPQCGFSRRAVAMLRDQGTEFSHFDILKDEAVRQGMCHFLLGVGCLADLEISGLKKYNNWPTFPQLIINGEFVGGLDIVQEMVENGEYAELMAL